MKKWIDILNDWETMSNVKSTPIKNEEVETGYMKLIRSHVIRFNIITILRFTIDLLLFFL